jgi:hypothetical protein
MDAKITQCTTIFSGILSIPTMGNTLFWFTIGVWLQVQIVGMSCGTPERDAYQEIG